MPIRNALVIDDEPDSARYIASILEENGWSVRTANSAEDGERLLREATPDLLLLDLVMPGRTGIQFFSRLRRDEETRELPLIMVTGIREQLNIDWRETVSKLKVRVPDGFIEKPVDPAQLIRLVEEVMRREKPVPRFA